MLRLERHVAGGAGGGVVWKKCRCLDLIDASYKLFPAIFFLSSAVFFLFFFTVERGKKKLAAQPWKNTAAGKDEARNNSVLGGITSEVVVDKDGPQAGLAPRGRRSVGFTSVNGGRGFGAAGAPRTPARATPYKT